MTQIELTISIKPSRLDRIFFWLFSKLEKIFCKNKYGLVSGWWQTWKLDFWAWKTILSGFPTDKMWLTSEYSVKFLRQLCSRNIKINVRSIICLNEIKSDRKCEVELEITTGNIVCTTAKFIFVEKIHNYCIDSAC